MRMRTLILFGFIFWLVIYSVGQIESFLDKDWFTIKEVNIQGKNSLVDEDIISKLMLLKEKKVWFVNVNKIEQELKKDIRIKDCKIRLQIPDKAFVYIEEKVPYTNILYNNKIYIADKEGIIFAKRLEFKNQDMLILNIEDEEDIEMLYLEIIKLSDEFRADLSEVYGSKEKINMIMKDGIVIKSKEDTEQEKYNVAYKLYLKLKEQKNEIEYIDLRFQDYIVK